MLSLAVECIYEFASSSGWLQVATAARGHEAYHIFSTGDGQICHQAYIVFSKQRP